MEARCFLIHKLKSLGATTILGRFGFNIRKFRIAAKPIDEEEEEKKKQDYSIYNDFCKRNFGDINYEIMKNSIPKTVQPEKIDLTEIVSRSIADVSYYHYLKRKEMFKQSLRKLTGPSSQIMRAHNYLEYKVKEEFGVDTYGLYVIDNKSDESSYCGKSINSQFYHQSSVIQKLLDTDYINTENTDYTYIEEELGADYEYSDIEAVEENEPNSHYSTPGEITFNGKALSLYNTEILTNSNTEAETN